MKAFLIVLTVWLTTANVVAQTITIEPLPSCSFQVGGITWSEECTTGKR